MRRVGIIAGVLGVLGIAGAAAAAGAGDGAAVRASPECDPAGILLSQMPDGRVDGCIRLGNLAAGPHTISLQDLLSFGPPGTEPPGIRTGVKPAPAPSEPAVRLTLSPDSGGPGTMVTVTGRLRRPFRLGAGHPNLCWNGCENGLSYGDPPLRQISPRVFQTRISIPAAPWIEGGPPRVAPLVTGDYGIGIDCFRAAHGCPSVSEGTATFHLRVSRPVAWCRTQATCARLTVRPARALPGEVVRVTGFAPLSAGDTPNAGTVYQLLVARRRPGTPEFRFTGHNGIRDPTAGLGAIEVGAAPAYHAVAPLDQVSDGVPQIAADPADPAQVAWCAGQTIAVEGPSGTTKVSTAAVNPALQAMGFSLRYEPQPPCAAVAPLATPTGAPAGLAAAFYVTTSAGAPPDFLAALVTRDNGQSWTPIPVPAGSAAAGFGAFRYRGAALQAVYSVSTKSPRPDYPEFNPDRPVTEVSSADGQSWSQAPLGCRTAGPCITFGPYQPGNCAMNGTTQTVLRSTDHGSRWSALDFPYGVQSCEQAQLIATSQTTELLVDSTSVYPVLRTTDGGATWHDIAIPKPPVGSNITVLPSGALLVTRGLDYQGRWRLLRPGARQWCTVQAPPAAAQRRFALTPVTAIGQTLWWLSGPVDNPDAAPAISQLPLSALSC